MNEILSWGLVVAVAIGLVALAFNALQVISSTDEFWIARFWFIAAALVLLARFIFWGITTTRSLTVRLIVCVIACGLIAAAAVEAVRYVNRKSDSWLQSRQTPDVSQREAGQVTAEGDRAVAERTAPPIELIYEPKPPYRIGPPTRGLTAMPPPDPVVMQVNMGIKNVSGKNIPRLRVALDAWDADGNRRLINMPLRVLNEMPPTPEHLLHAESELIFGVFRWTSQADSLSAYSLIDDQTGGLPVEQIKKFALTIIGDGIEARRYEFEIRFQVYNILYQVIRCDRMRV